MSSDNFKQGKGHMNSFTWWRDRAKSCPRIDNLFWEELPVTRHLCSIGKRACLPVHSDTDALVLTTAFFFFNHQLILNHQLVLNHQSRKRDLIVLSFLQMVEITVQSLSSLRMRVVLKTGRTRQRASWIQLTKTNMKLLLSARAHERHWETVIVSKAGDRSIFPDMGTGTHLLPEDPRMDLWPPASLWSSFLVSGQESICSKMAIPYPTGRSPTLILMGHLLFL